PNAAPTLPYHTLFPSRRPSDLQDERELEGDQERLGGTREPELAVGKQGMIGRISRPITSTYSTMTHPTMLASSTATRLLRMRQRDRKSTRLNSSHEWISYAVFC